MNKFWMTMIAASMLATPAMAQYVETPQDRLADQQRDEQLASLCDRPTTPAMMRDYGFSQYGEADCFQAVNVAALASPLDHWIASLPYEHHTN